MGKKKKITFEDKFCFAGILNYFHLWMRDQNWRTIEEYWDLIDLFIDNWHKPGFLYRDEAKPICNEENITST